MLDIIAREHGISSMSSVLTVTASCGMGWRGRRHGQRPLHPELVSVLPLRVPAVSLFPATAGEAGPPRLPAAARELRARLRPPGPHDAASVHDPCPAARSATAEPRVEHLDPRELRWQQPWPGPRCRHARHVVDQRLAEDVRDGRGTVAGDVLDLVEFLEPDPPVPLGAPCDADDQRWRDMKSWRSSM